MSPKRPRASDRLRRETIERQGNRCWNCGLKESEVEGSFEIHRLTPGREQGIYIASNTVALCRPCHVRMEGFTYEEVLEWRPYGESLSPKIPYSPAPSPTPSLVAEKKTPYEF